jgi:DNA-binding transcriptional ArsR family regulator
MKQIVALPVITTPALPSRHASVVSCLASSHKLIRAIIRTEEESPRGGVADEAHVFELSGDETRRVDEVVAEHAAPVVLWRSLIGDLHIKPLPRRVAPYTVGRAEAEDIVIDQDDVSSRHLLITVVSARDVYVVDDRSRNGSKLNGVPLRARERLRDGAVLRMASRAQLLLRVPGEVKFTVVTIGHERLATLSARRLEVLWWLCEPMVRRGRAVPTSREDLCKGLGMSASTLGEHLSGLREFFGVDAGHGMAMSIARMAIDAGIGDFPVPKPARTGHDTG